ncbi:protein Iojap-related, mitochondrial isoform X3 [Ziziphus jujuba]|uniref:Protein Iojap-related, mitochondrial isoform X3 n=1 Tax=Ziziphus jujuba TaxID=326968 RepID=A0A6P3YUY9_ZIZJJ|nr:protein Iojap-related, mitochondrial isoform X3 [Ziziphus jujuba]
MALSTSRTLLRSFASLSPFARCSNSTSYGDSLWSSEPRAIFKGGSYFLAQRKLSSTSVLSLGSIEGAFPSLLQEWKLGFPSLSRALYCSTADFKKNELLELQEVEKVLSDVRADNVKVIPVQKHCAWADFMVIATGRSTWHVKNIAQALIYKVKQKQKGAQRLMLPSVEGQEGGKWIVIDSGKVVVHALDEKARDYYSLESLWTTGTSEKEPIQDLEKALVKIRRKNNSKKQAKKSA